MHNVFFNIFKTSPNVYYNYSLGHNAYLYRL